MKNIYVFTVPEIIHCSCRRHLGKVFTAPDMVHCSRGEHLDLYCLRDDPWFSWRIYVFTVPEIIHLLLSEVLDHQVTAYVKGDFLSNFLWILIIFKEQIPKDDLSKLNFRWYHVKEQPKVLLCTKALITIDWKWLKSTTKLAGSPLSGEKLPVATNIRK